MTQYKTNVGSNSLMASE